MKKSRDSRDVFGVFKKGSFMEEASFGEKLKYWFKNVYWFHFKRATLVVAFVLVLLITLIYDLSHIEHNDLDYILAGSVFADTEQMHALSEYLGDFVNDDGTATVGHQMLCTESTVATPGGAGQVDEFAAANITKISVTMADDEVLLFLFDKKYAEWYANDGAFEPISKLGIESENPYYVEVTDNEKIKELGIIHKDGIYAAIKICAGARSENERIMQKYENAKKAIRGLVGAD